MSHPEKKPKKACGLMVAVAATAIISVGATIAGIHLLGYLAMPAGEIRQPPGNLQNPNQTDGQERKIAYWQAPMNPTEIYDQPGKSAMGMDLVPVYEDELAGAAAEGEAERKIAYWRAPMNPTEIYDKPGKSAMGMDLVPVYEDELVGGVEVKVDPVTQQNMGIRTAEVVEKAMRHTIRTYGHVTTDETRTIRISPKVDGWIEKLYVNFTGIFVEKGAPLFEIYSPALLAAQEEYLVALKSLKHGGGSGNLLVSARRRLTYFDVPEEQIQAIEQTGQVTKTLLIRSPFSGYVIEKKIEQGGFIKAGTTVLRVADLTRVWVEAHIYESELPMVALGQTAEMRLPYQPGRVFAGQVAYIYPYLQAKTRDVIVRLEFGNPDQVLKPDMHADVVIRTTSAKGIVIPYEAVIRSGERNVVFVTRDNNKFTPRNVTLGLTLDQGEVQILTGVVPGETVVSSGQFLLDSESKLKEAVAKMLEAKRTRGKETQATKPETAANVDDFFNEMDDAAPEEDAAEPEDEDFFEDLEAEEDFFSDMQ